MSSGREAGGIRFWMPVLLTAAAFAFLVGFLVHNRGHLVEFYTVSPLPFGGIALLTLAILVLLGLANKIHFGDMGMAGSFHDWFHLVTVSAFTNYLPANAGIAVKAFYLKRVHGKPYRTILSGQVTLFIVFVAAGGVCGLAALALLPKTKLTGIITAALLVMAAAGSLLFLPERLLRRIGGSLLGDHLADARTGSGPVFAVAGVQGAILLATAAKLKISFDMGPAAVPFAACLVLASVAPLSRLVAITPGALGIRELLFGGLAYLMGFTVRDAIIASTFSRLVEVTVVCSLGAFYTWRLSGRIASSFAKDHFPGTGRYWEERYAGGGDSGHGSAGAAARLKADFLNDFSMKHEIHTVIEFGCGDGGQLALARYETYSGYDISPTAVETCRRKFAADDSREFYGLGDYDGRQAEAALSLDVIYHLVEDDVFEAYMTRLFGAATRYVIIYSTNTERQAAFGKGHVRHRRFTDWAERNAPQWRLARRRPGWHRFGRLYRGEHRADFFVYEKTASAGGGS